MNKAQMIQAALMGHVGAVERLIQLVDPQTPEQIRLAAENLVDVAAGHGQVLTFTQGAHHAQ